MNFIAAKNYIAGRLEKELSSNLHYHRIEHTFDIHRAALQLMVMENTDPYSAKLIETATFYHDAGMITSYQDHELVSVDLARKILPEFDYSDQEIEEISALILVTQMPQAAITQNEMIICDADLDALGREDFFITSLQLQLEWKLYGVMDTTIMEWFKFEIDFMEKHNYYTSSARKLRDVQKRRNLIELKDLIR
jgi:predicted metal-dependent HD superfamily phosphohydrolase